MGNCLDSSAKVDTATSGNLQIFFFSFNIIKDFVLVSGFMRIFMALEL